MPDMKYLRRTSTTSTFFAGSPMPSPLVTSVAPSLYTPLEPIDRKELPQVLAPLSPGPECCLELSNFFSCGTSHGTSKHSCPRHGKEHTLGSASLQDLPYELVEQEPLRESDSDNAQGEQDAGRPQLHIQVPSSSVGTQVPLAATVAPVSA